ncbi:uncharacterized protein I303_107076 [Kwoniella dejecticola CBS 10117]|uniref:Uncharacterized protein n=1 Tax=Kwoniella dejecticola CBS 10117 TaxID=1296121 RepID=A0A1A5ZYN9_9TREE|nr:uncharacterized protein I303_06477 [Kwoniella dejecticola CBS 10117]OBR82919.1 hypothetical protein I303_06477 [Kwoniella dejecticola CBS 10117]
MSYRGYSGYDPNYSGYKASNAPPIIPVSREEVLANCSQQSYPVPPTATGYQEWELPFSPCADCRGLQLPAKTDSWRIPVSEMATPETFLAYIDLPGTVSDLYAREGASREILDDLTSKAQESALNSYYQTYPRGGQAYYQNSPQYSGDSEHGAVAEEIDGSSARATVLYYGILPVVVHGRAPC